MQRKFVSPLGDPPQAGTIPFFFVENSLLYSLGTFPYTYYILLGIMSTNKIGTTPKIRDTPHEA